jgi:hypothetical protein
MKSNGSISREGVFAAVAVTIIACCFFWFMIYNINYSRDYDLIPNSIWLFFWLSFIIYPIIGRFIVLINEGIYRLMNYIYNYEDNDKRGYWTPSERLVYAILWPILGPIMFVYGLIAVIYGFLINKLF